MSLAQYSDAQLVRIARGDATPKRSAFLSALRRDALAPLHRPKQPLAIVYRHDAMPPPVPLDASDGHIRKIAKRLAYYCAGDVPGAGDDFECMAHLRNVCRAHHVDPPEVDPDASMKPAFARLACARWWRRRLRVSVARRTEERLVAAGAVHRAAQVYASDAAVYRRRQSTSRNRALLEMLTAVNENGEAFNLAELSDLSTSNPEMRRNELMTRAAGLEQVANLRGDRAMFVTWTLPSRFHAVHSESGLKNLNYDKSTPKQGAAWFAAAWARVRAYLAKSGIRLYGLRVAEPHHDETPHWHLLIFAPLGKRRDPNCVHREIAAAIAREAFAEGDEKGARKHRLKFELIKKGIDPLTGKEHSAVGYVSKYIAKNVDGFQLEHAMERGADGEMRFTGEAITAAERIRAWASTWGIRQFQFFGTPPVTWWRELRRVREAGEPVGVIEAARSQADQGDYAGHVVTVGGVAVPKKARPLETHKALRLDADGQLIPTLYGDDPAPVVKGVNEFKTAHTDREFGVLRHLAKLESTLKVHRRRRRGFAVKRELVDRLITRIHSWTVLEPREVGPAAPRTRVNNCNRSENDGPESSNPRSLFERQPIGGGWIKPGDAGRVLAGLGWRSDLDPEPADDLDGFDGFDLDGPGGAGDESHPWREEGMDHGSC